MIQNNTVVQGVGNVKNYKHYPKIIVLTLPLREEPTTFPPLGSLSVITALKKSGFENTHFYNLDVLRPKYKEILAFLEKENPDIIGISAIVSTAGFMETFAYSHMRQADSMDDGYRPAL